MSITEACTNQFLHMGGLVILVVGVFEFEVEAVGFEYHDLNLEALFGGTDRTSDAPYYGKAHSSRYIFSRALLPLAVDFGPTEGTRPGTQGEQPFQDFGRSSVNPCVDA